MMRGSVEYARFFKDEVSEQNFQWLKNISFSTGYLEQVLLFQRGLANLSTDAERLTTYRTADKKLHAVFRTEPCLHLKD